VAFDKNGQITGRTVISDRHETRPQAIAAAEAEAIKHKPCGRNRQDDRWWITFDRGRTHWLVIENY
jgi:hypothetical protein